MSDDDRPPPDQPGDDGFGLDDVDAIARRAVDSVLTLVRRGTALAGGVLIIAIVCCIGGFLLGLAALSGGIETVWWVLGGFFLILGIGTVLTAILRLRSVRRSATQLGDEFRSLISGDARTERTIIETVETNDQSQEEGVVVMSRQFFTMRESIGDRVHQFRTLGSALSAVTSFPGLVALSTLISFVFAGLSLLFLIAIAL